MVYEDPNQKPLERYDDLSWYLRGLKKAGESPILFVGAITSIICLLLFVVSFFLNDREALFTLLMWGFAPIIIFPVLALICIVFICMKSYRLFIAAAIDLIICLPIFYLSIVNQEVPIFTIFIWGFAPVLIFLLIALICLKPYRLITAGAIVSTICLLIYDLSFKNNDSPTFTLFMWGFVPPIIFSVNALICIALMYMKPYRLTVKDIYSNIKAFFFGKINCDEFEQNCLFVDDSSSLEERMLLKMKLRNGYITKAQFDELFEKYNLTKTREPKFWIYLNTSPEAAYRNLQKLIEELESEGKGTSVKEAITLDYLKNLNEMYVEWKNEMKVKHTGRFIIVEYEKFEPLETMLTIINDNF